jgi:hypothetical protein
MKKYLMTGIAALSMCFGFTSCSHDFDTLSQEEIDQMKANEIVENYKKAFVAQFGQPAADQDWGFGTTTRSLTRSENANANEWADPNKAYGGLKVPPPLTDEQIAVVTKYFQITRGLGYEDPKWENYFMQQVYKGHTSPREGYSPEAYLAANGSTYLYASDYMDHLAAIDESKNFVDHINNFNHGDCSTNGTVLDNGGNANDGPFHSDKIMYMKESTTKSFGYYNSNGSVRRTEYTGLVSYKTIMKALGSEADCLEDGWNRSFMGFDFEQMVGPEIYAKELDYSAGWSADIPGGFPVKDYIWFEWKGQKYHMLVAEQNMYCGTPLDISDAQVQEDGFIDNLLAQGYLPVTGGANKKWVKVGGCADGYYSDWIVCLTEAKTSQTPPPSNDEYTIRVIAEDLTYGQDLDTDFDFNDVVFDVCLKATETKIRLKAAGGTLPLIIGVANPQNDQDYLENEVHNLFRVAVNVMVNTNAHLKGLNSDSKNDVIFTLNTAYTNAKDIPVYVKKNGTWVELTAVRGEPASKIGVGLDYVWVNERESLKGTYDKFVKWVEADANERNFKWW